MPSRSPDTSEAFDVEHRPVAPCFRDAVGVKQKDIARRKVELLRLQRIGNVTLQSQPETRTPERFDGPGRSALTNVRRTGKWLLARYP